MASLEVSAAVQLPNEEYEAQFFGFLPSSLVEGIVRLIEDRMSGALDEVEEHLTKIPESILSRDERQSGLSNLRGKTSLHTTRVLTKLQQHLTSALLRLPPHLLLPSDLEQNKPTTSVMLERTRADLQALRTQLDGELYMQAALRAEIEESNKLLQQQQRVLALLPQPSCINYTSVKEDLAFLRDNAKEQITALSSLQRGSAAVLGRAELQQRDIPAHLGALKNTLQQ